MSFDPALFQRFGRTFPVGAVLCREGDKGDEMFVIHSGLVRITRQMGVSSKVLADLGPGEFFGEMSILTGDPRSATATVQEEAQVLIIKGETLEAMIKASTEIAVRMVRRLAERLYDANAHIEALLLGDPTSRVARHLVTLGRRRGGALQVSAAELGPQLSLTTAQVEEGLQKVAQKGLITVEAGGVQIGDIERLQQYAEFLEMREQFGDD